MKQRKNELVGGGHFVFRRGKTSGRISRGGKANFPMEHPTFDAAVAEAHRLAARFPGETFCVFSQMTSIKEVADV